jgi:hypothetical protein
LQVVRSICSRVDPNSIPEFLKSLLITTHHESQKKQVYTVNHLDSERRAIINGNHTLAFYEPCLGENKRTG